MYAGPHMQPALRRDIRHLPNLGRFLLLYFVYSDGYSAIGTLGVLFALNEVAVPQALLVLLLVETQLCALTGCIVFAKIQKWLQTSKGIPVHRSAISIIAINLFIMGLLPVYGLLGAIQAMPFGLKTASEVFIFGAIYGFQIGAVQTYSRSVFSSMVCPLTLFATTFARTWHCELYSTPPPPLSQLFQFDFTTVITGSQGLRMHFFRRL
jgi:MFS-type transporter involved in bile tolerance (Atg22 family)